MNDTFARIHICNGSLTLVRIINSSSSSYSTRMNSIKRTRNEMSKNKNEQNTLGKQHHLLCACRLSSYHIELRHFAKCLIQILKCCHWFLVQLVRWLNYSQSFLWANRMNFYLHLAVCRIKTRIKDGEKKQQQSNQTRETNNCSSSNTSSSHYINKF